MISVVAPCGLLSIRKKSMTKWNVKRRVFQISHSYLLLIVNNNNLIEVFYILDRNVSILVP